MVEKKKTSWAAVSKHGDKSDLGQGYGGKQVSTALI